MKVHYEANNTADRATPRESSFACVREATTVGRRYLSSNEEFPRLLEKGASDVHSQDEDSYMSFTLLLIDDELDRPNEIGLWP